MASPWEQIDSEWAWSPFVPTNERRWDRRLAAHLYRRAAFGATAAQLDAAVSLSPGEAVDRLVTGEAQTAANRQASERLAETVLATGNPRQLSAWWLYELLHTRHPLLERLTLFWHGHFATSAEKVTDAATMLAQNRLLRRHALGNFRQFAQDISRDPAMLIYLDSVTNRKAHPNENYARELMELFCLGEGNYSEKDVQELARCFTGWEIKQGSFRFNRFQHDSGNKTILGKTAAFAEGTAIDWVVDQPAAPRFIVGKLFRAFCSDEPAPPTELLEPLVKQLRETDWDLGATVRRILGSNLFFSPAVVGRKVRSPVDLVVGLLRTLEGSANTQQLAGDLEQMEQGLFFPPNVKGWDGGRAWINSATVISRANGVGRLLRDEKTRFAGGSLADYWRRSQAPSTEVWLTHLEELLLAVPLRTEARNRLLTVARGASDEANGTLDTLLALTALPEFQLA